MTGSFSQDAPATVETLISQLDSTASGEEAMYRLVTIGQDAVPALEAYLVAGKARSLAASRCRAVRALGMLGAQNSLLLYLEKYKPPEDAMVLFAEDAVRSAVADELLAWKTDEVYAALLQASRQRATGYLLRAVGQFRRTESLPLLFHYLEDDLCRQEAETALRLMPNEATHYALASLHGETELNLKNPGARRLTRATLKLLNEASLPDGEWKYIEPFLQSKDASIVLAAANIGLQQVSSLDARSIFAELFRIADHLDWLQEAEVLDLAKANPDAAKQAAHQVIADRVARGLTPSRMSPSWRILDSVLDNRLFRPQKNRLK